MADTIVETTLRAAATLAGSATAKTAPCPAYGMTQIVFFFEASDADTLASVGVEVSNKSDASDSDWEDATDVGYVVVGDSGVVAKRFDHGRRCLTMAPTGGPRYCSHSFARITMTADSNAIDNLMVVSSAFKEGPAAGL